MRLLIVNLFMSKKATLFKQFQIRPHVAVCLSIQKLSYIFGRMAMVKVVNDRKDRENQDLNALSKQVRNVYDKRSVF